MVDGSSHRLFRGHVADRPLGRPCRFGGGPSRPRHDGKPEVDEFAGPVAGEQDVPRFHIAVHHAEPAGGVEPFEYVEGNLYGTRRSHAAGLLDEVGRTEAVDELHDHVGPGRVVFKIEHANDVRVRQLREQLGFPGEPREGVRVGREDIGTDELHGDRRLEFRVEGPVHHPGPAGADALDQQVLSDLRSRLRGGHRLGDCGSRHRLGRPRRRRICSRVRSSGNAAAGRARWRMRGGAVARRRRRHEMPGGVRTGDRAGTGRREHAGTRTLNRARDVLGHAAGSHADRTRGETPVDARIARGVVGHARAHPANLGVDAAGLFEERPRDQLPLRNQDRPSDRVEEVLRRPGTEQRDEILGRLDVHSFGNFDLDPLAVDRALTGEPAFGPHLGHQRERALFARAHGRKLVHSPLDPDVAGRAEPLPAARHEYVHVVAEQARQERAAGFDQRGFRERMQGDLLHRSPPEEARTGTVSAGRLGPP